MNDEEDVLQGVRMIALVLVALVLLTGATYLADKHFGGWGVLGLWTALLGGVVLGAHLRLRSIERAKTIAAITRRLSS